MKTNEELQRMFMSLAQRNSTIRIQSESQAAIEQKDEAATIYMNCAVFENEIHVSVSGTTVTLTGTVDSWYQREEAGRIAWKTSGIWHVKNELEVGFEYAFN